NDQIKAFKTGKSKALVQVGRKNHIQAVKGDDTLYPREISQNQTISRNQSVIKMDKTDIRIFLQDQPYPFLKHPKKANATFPWLQHKGVHPGQAFHPIDQFEALLFHSSGGRRIFMTHK